MSSMTMNISYCLVSVASNLMQYPNYEPSGRGDGGISSEQPNQSMQPYGETVGDIIIR